VATLYCGAIVVAGFVILKTWDFGVAYGLVVGAGPLDALFVPEFKQAKWADVQQSLKSANGTLEFFCPVHYTMPH
jgi:hypothetical protein